MTLILAIGCEDGIVMAADSAVTEADTGTKLPGEKISRLGDHPILYGSSGSSGLRQKIDHALAPFKPNPKSLWQTRNTIKSLIVPELRSSSDQHVPYPKPPFDAPPVAILLFAGVHNQRPFILEIERDGSDTEYDDRLGNFAAIGSGKGLAHAVFRPHLRKERKLQEGKVLAYRVMEDAIDLAAAHLARPIHVFTVSLDGSVEELSKKDGEQLQVTANLWRGIERDSLGEALSPERHRVPEPTTEPPKPKVNKATQTPVK